MLLDDWILKQFKPFFTVVQRSVIETTSMTRILFKKKILEMTFQEIIQSEKPVLIDFFAEWCGPCKMLAPVLKDVKNTLGEKVQIVKIDVDKNQTLAGQYQIRSVPTLMIAKKGKILWKESGMLTKGQLVQLLEQYA